MIKKSTATLFILLITITAWAGKIDKGIKAINEKNYQKAKEYFEEVLKEKPNHAGASFGMARYYAATDNPLFDPDKAYQHILTAIADYKTAASDVKKEISDAGITDNDFENLKNTISGLAYANIVKQNTVEGFDHFINEYKDAQEMQSAVSKRNEIAFKKAETENTSSSYKDFMNKYPSASQYDKAGRIYEEKLFEEKTKDGSAESFKSFFTENPKSAFAVTAKEKYEQIIYEKYFKDGTIESIEEFIKKYPESSYIKLARDRYEKLLFETKTKDKTIESYIMFINQYPSSMYFTQAEEQVYLLATKGDKTPATYLNFINTYPTNSYTKNAWKTIYNMEINYTDTTSFSKFAAKYKNYPDLKGIEKLIQQYRKSLFCIKCKNGKWGYMDETGKLYISCTYEKASNFIDGLALVQKDSKYGFINKGNTEMIKCVYDFAYEQKGNYARVKGNGKYGMINRNGDTIIPLNYEDIADFNKEGLARVKKGSKYGYVDMRNRVVIEPKYDETKEFYDGYCLVRKDESWLLIDKNGAQIYCIE